VKQCLLEPEDCHIHEALLKPKPKPRALALALAPGPGPWPWPLSLSLLAGDQLLRDQRGLGAQKRSPLFLTSELVVGIVDIICLFAS
jgi:hypothetical protein